MAEDIVDRLNQIIARTDDNDWSEHWLKILARECANEIGRLRHIIRVNTLRQGASDDEINKLIYNKNV